MLSNFPLDFAQVRYVFSTKKTTNSQVWGVQQESHIISTTEFPFNWMQPYAKEAGIIAALARDSDRMLLLFQMEVTFPYCMYFLPTFIMIPFGYFVGHNL